MNLLNKMAEDYAEIHVQIERKNNFDSQFVTGTSFQMQEAALEVFKQGLIRVYVDGFKAAREMAVKRAHDWDMKDSYPNNLHEALMSIGEDETK